MAICFPVKAPTAWGTFYIFSNFCYGLPFVRGSGTFNDFILEFIYNCSTRFFYYQRHGVLWHSEVKLHAGIVVMTGQMSQSNCYLHIWFYGFPVVGVSLCDSWSYSLHSDWIRRKKCLTFYGSQVSSPKQIANYFNRLFPVRPG